METLEKSLIALTLAIASTVYASSCGLQPYWTKDTMKARDYPSNCNSPYCPGHRLPSDRCPKKFSDRIKYFWK